MANLWEDEILAYKRGDKITTNTLRDMFQDHERGATVLTNQWKDKSPVYNKGGMRSPPTRGGTSSRPTSGRTRS